MQKGKLVKLILLIVALVLDAAICTIFMIGGTKVGNDDYVVYGFLVLFVSLPLFIWGIISTAKTNHTIQVPKKQPSQLEKLVKEKIKTLPNLNFGVWGSFNVNKIDVEGVIKYAEKQNVDINKQLEFVMQTVNKWCELINQNIQYFINYFVSSGVTWFDDYPFWKNYNTNPKQYTDEKCFEILKNISLCDEKDFEPYLEINTTKNIVDYLKNKIPFFNIEKYINEIKVEFVTFNKDSFSIQVSDINSSCLCGAYEEFDEELKGLDFHNF